MKNLVKFVSMKSYVLFKVMTLVITFALILCSCRTDKDDSDSKNKIDLTAFNKYKSTNFGKYLPANNQNSKGVDQFAASLSLINNDFNTSLTVNNLDNQLISNTGSAIEPLEIIDDYLTMQQISLLNTFESNLNSQGFNTAIHLLENQITAMNLTNSEFQKYNSIINVIYLMENYNSDLFTVEAATNAISPCAKAIIANAIATVGLASCGTGILCAVAIAGKILALDAVIDNCGKKK